MPCRPDDDNLPPRSALSDIESRADAFDRERIVVLTLLRALLDAPVVPATLRTAVDALVFHPAKTTPSAAPTGTRRSGFSAGESQALARMREAERHLCIARHVLLQVLPLLPASVTAPHLAAIDQERSRQLAHRHADCAAEIDSLKAALMRLVSTFATPATIAASSDETERLRAEVAHLRGEVARLQNLTDAQLLANRDFSQVQARCPSCDKQLPLLSGMDGDKLQQVLAAIGKRKIIEAIKLVRFATGIGLREAKQFVECPHGPFAVPADAAPSPGRCPLCGEALPPLPTATPQILGEVLRTLGAGNKLEAIRLIRSASGWGLKQSKDYVDCPHDHA